MTGEPDPSELSLVAWSSPFAFGFVLPLYGKHPLANRYYTAVGSMPGDHVGQIVGFEPMKIEQVELLPADKIRSAKVGDPWIDVFKTRDDVLVGTPRELSSGLGEAGRREVGRVAPLSLFDLAISADRPERARLAKKAFQHVKSRFDEKRARDWKLSVLRAEIQIDVQRKLAGAGASGSITRAARFVSLRLNSRGEPVIEFPSAVALQLERSPWRDLLQEQTARFAREFDAEPRARKPKAKQVRADPPDDFDLDKPHEQIVAGRAQPLVWRSLIREFSLSSPTDDFAELVRLAGLRPERDLRFGDFSDCRLDKQLLRGFDFTGCDLTGASFDGARIEAAILDCAVLDPAALARAQDYPAFLKADLARPPASRRRIATRRLNDFDSFREAPFAPEMIVLPADEFDMGSALDEAALGEDDRAFDDEIAPGKGKRRMRIPRRFALGRTPVTFDEYDVFCDATERERLPDRGWRRERRPAIHVTWLEAQAYVDWLNGRIGTSAYRLPSEAEWEYSCRAGENTRRWWGDSWDPARANGAQSFEGGRTSPVDHFPPNRWGLRDMIGNVWEWCADEWVDNIAKLPEDGVAFGAIDRVIVSKQTKKEKKREPKARRVLRGGSWSGDPRGLRSAVRGRGGPGGRDDRVGFRLSRTL